MKNSGKIVFILNLNGTVTRHRHKKVTGRSMFRRWRWRNVCLQENLVGMEVFGPTLILSVS